MEINRRAFKTALGEVAQRLVHLRLQRVADVLRVVGALPQLPRRTERIRLERRAPEEGDEVEKPNRFARLGSVLDSAIEMCGDTPIATAMRTTVVPPLPHIATDSGEVRRTLL